MKNKTDVNISVFTDIPHGRADDNSTHIDSIRAMSKKTIIKKYYGISDDWNGKTVIEFGCGSGHKLLPFGLQGAKLLGVDGSETQLARISRNAAELGIEGTFIQSRLEDIKASDLSEADLVICSAVLHHVHEWAKLIKIISEVMKPNSCLYLTWTDWTLHLSGFNIKNQISYRLGWNTKSRLKVGRFLFGWWDKNRNVMNLDDDSFFADLYAAYYIPLSYQTVKNELKKNGLTIINTTPPHDLKHYLKAHEFSGTHGRFSEIFRKHENSPLKILINLMLRLRYYLVPKHKPRVLSARKTETSRTSNSGNP